MRASFSSIRIPRFGNNFPVLSFPILVFQIPFGYFSVQGTQS
jgi:hypothetical protein